MKQFSNQQYNYWYNYHGYKIDVLNGIVHPKRQRKASHFGKLGWLINGKYLAVTINNKNILIHHLIYCLFWNLSLDSIDQIDHINRNTQDNSIFNLRQCTNKLNSLNRELRSDNNTGFIGVRRTKNGKYTCSFRSKHLGTFNSAESAHNHLINKLPDLLSPEETRYVDRVTTNKRVKRDHLTDSFKSNQKHEEKLDMTTVYDTLNEEIFKHNFNESPNKISQVINQPTTRNISKEPYLPKTIRDYFKSASTITIPATKHPQYNTDNNILTNKHSHDPKTHSIPTVQHKYTQSQLKNVKYNNIYSNESNNNNNILKFQDKSTQTPVEYFQIISSSLIQYEKEKNSKKLQVEETPLEPMQICTNYGMEFIQDRKTRKMHPEYFDDSDEYEDDARSAIWTEDESDE